MLSLVRQTLDAWWRELIPLTLLNAVWLGLQFLIIPAAPATAAFYVVAGSVSAGDDASWREFWQGFRRYFWKAISWGLLQVAIYFIGAFNFIYYNDETGPLWGTVKLVWGAFLVVWSVLQVLFWPLLLEAEDQSLRNTLRNALVMLWLNPLFVLAMAALTVFVLVACVFTGVLAGLVMMPLVTLLGTFAVKDRLQAFRSAQKRHKR